MIPPPTTTTSWVTPRRPSPVARHPPVCGPPPATCHWSSARGPPLQPSTGDRSSPTALRGPPATPFPRPVPPLSRGYWKLLIGGWQLRPAPLRPPPAGGGGGDSAPPWPG